MEYYKVLYKDLDGKLYSALDTSLSAIEYTETTKGPNGTPLFVFDNLNDARAFANHSNVIYRVSVVNPIKYRQKILNYTLLFLLGPQEVAKFWKNEHDVVGIDIGFAPFGTCLCDELTLLEIVV